MCTSIDFGPDHPAHRRVSWPKDLESVTIQLPSSFIQLLSHNIALSTSEANRVRELQAEIHQRVQESTDEPAEADSADEHSKQSEKQLFAFTVLLAPFRTLPPDILYQFVQYLPVYGPPYSGSHHIHVPSTLAQVSTLWRNLLHGMPRLWDTVRIFYQHKRSNSEMRLQHFGRLSGSLPLTIEIEDAMETTGILVKDDPDEAQLLNWILYSWGDSHRIVALGISSVRLRRLLKGLAPSPNNNSTLKVQIFRYIENPFDVDYTLAKLTEYLDMFPDLCGLWIESASLRGLDQPLPENMPALRSWSDLTRLYVERDSMNGMVPFWNILRICPRLEVACIPITASSTGHNTPAPSKIIVHHHLRELGLDLCLLDGVSLYSALSECRFPYVASLHITAMDDNRLSVQCSSSVEVQIFPSLERLFIVGNEYDVVSLHSILCPLRTITELTIPYFDRARCIDDTKNIEFLTCPTEETSTNGGTAVVGGSHLTPDLTKLRLQFHYRYVRHLAWHQIQALGKDHQQSIMHSIRKLQESRPSTSISLELVEYVDWRNTFYENVRVYDEVAKAAFIDQQKVRQQCYSTLIAEFKEIGVDIDIIRIDGNTPEYYETLRHQFVPYFRL